MSRITHWRVHRGFLVLAAVVGTVYACEGRADSLESYKAHMTPPAKYLRPYTGSLRVLYKDPREVAKDCHGAIACAFVARGMCDVVLPTRVLGRFSMWTEDEIYLHEIAHCNGWVHE